MGLCGLGELRRMVSQFGAHGCRQLQLSALDVPDLPGVANMSALFSYALSFNGDVNQWNTTDVTNSEHELYVSCSILIQRRCESMGNRLSHQYGLCVR